MSDPAEAILADYELESKFAKAHDVSQPTIARYRNQPNGLPWVKFGGRIYIHIPGARRWLERRTLQLNPRRGA